MTTATALNTTSVRNDLTDALRAYPAKVLARWADASVRAAEKWRAGEREPSGAALLAMMRRNNELAEKLLGDI